MQLRTGLADVPIEGVISSVATKGGMTGGTLAAIYGWLSSSSAAVLIGILITVIGFVVNFYYQYRRNHREEIESKERAEREKELHAIRMLQAKILNGVNNVEAESTE